MIAAGRTRAKDSIVGTLISLSPQEEIKITMGEDLLGEEESLVRLRFVRARGARSDLDLGRPSELSKLVRSERETEDQK